MEQPKGNWGEYYEKTEGMPERPLLKRALQYVTEKDAALDLGAGVLADSNYLLQEGFGHVTAVDVDPAVRTFADAITDSRFECVIAPFETFAFQPNTYDLISAQFSLPFVQRESFEQVLLDMQRALKSGGIFTGQLFGMRNGSFKNIEISRVAREEIETLFPDMELLELREEEEDGTTAVGSPMHWHLFYIIARKR